MQLADELRKAVKNCEDGQIDERLLPVKFIKKDSWDEPTDGTWTMKRSDYERDLRQYGPDEYNAEWWWRKEAHKLKSKNQHANFRKYRKTKNNLLLWQTYIRSITRRAIQKKRTASDSKSKKRKKPLRGTAPNLISRSIVKWEADMSVSYKGPKCNCCGIHFDTHSAPSECEGCNGESSQEAENQ